MKNLLYILALIAVGNTLQGMEPAKKKEKLSFNKKVSDCSICFDKMEQDQDFSCFPCQHAIHFSCFKELSQSKRDHEKVNCPLCRFSLSDAQRIELYHKASGQIISAHPFSPFEAQLIKKLMQETSIEKAAHNIKILALTNQYFALSISNSKNTQYIVQELAKNFDIPVDIATQALGTRIAHRVFEQLPVQKNLFETNEEILRKQIEALIISPDEPKALDKTLKKIDTFFLNKKFSRTTKRFIVSYLCDIVAQKYTSGNKLAALLLLEPQYCNQEKDDAMAVCSKDAKIQALLTLAKTYEAHQFPYKYVIETLNHGLLQCECSHKTSLDYAFSPEKCSCPQSIKNARLMLDDIYLYGACNYPYAVKDFQLPFLAKENYGKVSDLSKSFNPRVVRLAQKWLDRYDERFAFGIF